jgi:hypothetical protein
LHNELIEAVTQQWQTDWDNYTKAAITKELFPNVSNRLKINISLNPNFTAMVTGHGRTRAYLHRFRIRSVPRGFSGGVQQIQLSIEGRKNGDLSAVAP